MEAWTMKNGKQVPLEGEDLIAFCRSTLATDRNKKRWAKVEPSKKAEIMERMRERLKVKRRGILKGEASES